jgi:hypothetical protein
MKSVSLHNEDVQSVLYDIDKVDCYPFRCGQLLQNAVGADCERDFMDDLSKFKKKWGLREMRGENKDNIYLTFGYIIDRYFYIYLVRANVSKDFIMEFEKHSA